MASNQPLAPSFQGGSPILSKQPFASIWGLFSIAKFVASAPFLCLYYLVPANRGSPKRQVKQEMSFAMLRAIFKWAHAVHYRMPRPMAPAKAWKEQFVMLEPGKDSLYAGVAIDSFIKPESVPGVWFPRRPSPSDISDGARVFMHFHGGAYATGQYEPEATGPASGLLVDKLSAFVLCVGHRKSSTPGCHFPAQLQDAITTYSNLLHQGIKPAKIIFSGNSSGGHVAFNLLRYIVQNPSFGLPKPAAIVTSSPWVDLLTSDFAAIEQRPNYNKDYIDFAFIKWCRGTFIPPGADVATNPYISLLHHPFDLGGVPAWIVAGCDEVVFDETYEFAKKLQQVPGNTVELYEAPHSPHDVMWTGPALGFMDESKLCVEKLGEFLQKHRL